MPRRARFFLAFIFLHFINGKQTVALQLLKGIATPSSNQKGQCQRRNFLVSCLQGTVLLQSAEAIASTSSLTTESSFEALQNYMYSENWVGTSLPILSLELAVATGESDFQMGRWPDPILRRTASKIEATMMGGPLLNSLAKKLRRTARVNKAVGLAAQQW